MDISHIHELEEITLFKCSLIVCLSIPQGMYTKNVVSKVALGGSGRSMGHTLEGDFSLSLAWLLADEVVLLLNMFLP